MSKDGVSVEGPTVFDGLQSTPGVPGVPNAVIGEQFRPDLPVPPVGKKYITTEDPQTGLPHRELVDNTPEQK